MPRSRPFGSQSRQRHPTVQSWVGRAPLPQDSDYLATIQWKTPSKRTAENTAADPESRHHKFQEQMLRPDAASKVPRSRPFGSQSRQRHPTLLRGYPTERKHIFRAAAWWRQCEKKQSLDCSMDARPLHAGACGADAEKLSFDCSVEAKPLHHSKNIHTPCPRYREKHAPKDCSSHPASPHCRSQPRVN